MSNTLFNLSRSEHSSDFPTITAINEPRINPLYFCIRANVLICIPMFADCHSCVSSYVWLWLQQSNIVYSTLVVVTNVMGMSPGARVEDSTMENPSQLQLLLF